MARRRIYRRSQVERLSPKPELLESAIRAMRLRGRCLIWSPRPAARRFTYQFRSSPIRPLTFQVVVCWGLILRSPRATITAVYSIRFAMAEEQVCTNFATHGD